MFEIKLVTKHDFSGFFRNLGNPDIASTRSLSRTRPHPSIRNFRILVSKPLYLPGVSLSLSLSEITLSLELEKFDTPRFYSRDPETFDNQIQSDQKLEIVKVCGQSYLIITGPHDKDTDAK